MGVKGNKAGPAYGFVIRKGDLAGPAASFGLIRVPYVGVGMIGAARTINADGLGADLSDGNFGRHLQIGSLRNNTEGSPAPPALQLDIPGFWRFRWAVGVGSHSIQCLVKQAINLSPRPTLVIIANPDIGLNANVTVTAPSGTGWVTLGPASLNASAVGAVWVELHNNYTSLYNSPAYFDHITDS
jgi:hypothetical protein